MEPGFGEDEFFVVQLCKFGRLSQRRPGECFDGADRLLPLVLL
jgi:hypothetical protein